TVRAEFDSHYHSLRTVSATGSYSVIGYLQTSVTWSKKALITQLLGFNDPNFLDQYINTSTTLHTRDNKYGGLYSLHFDVLHTSMLQQRMSGYYNAQCCGLAFEYQNYNYSGIGLAAD